MEEAVVEERLSREPSDRTREVAALVRLLGSQMGDAQPEKRLWLSVVERALKDAYGRSAPGDDLGVEARRWLDSEACADILASIGLNPGWVRKKIARLDPA